MPIGSLLNAASSVAGATAGAPVGPSRTDIAPVVNAINSAPFAVGRGARATAPQPKVGMGGGAIDSGLGGASILAVAVVIGAVILARR